MFAATQFTIVLFALLALNCCVGNRAWDDWNFGVTCGSEIIFYDQHWTPVRNVSHCRFGRMIISLNADSDDNVIVLSNTKGLMYFQLDDDSDKPLNIVSDTMKDWSGADGITFDPVEKSYYWTESNSRTIFKSQLNDAGNAFTSSEFIKFENKIPHGIDFDVCGRSLYWSNRNREKMSIEKIDLKIKDKSHTIIPSHKLTYPLDIHIDQMEGRMYWIDGTNNDHFSIESANLDGSHHKILIKEMDQKPHSLTTNSEMIYWTDQQNHKVWSMPKSGTARPNTLATFTMTPRGIVLNKRLNTTDIGHICRINNEQSIRETRNIYKRSCSEISYRNASIYRNVNDQLVCDCLEDFNGPKCENITNANECYNYCLNTRLFNSNNLCSGVYH